MIIALSTDTTPRRYIIWGTIDRTLFYCYFNKIKIWGFTNENNWQHYVAYLKIGYTDIATKKSNRTYGINHFFLNERIVSQKAERLGCY